jgi:hypothetical protein
MAKVADRPLTASDGANRWYRAREGTGRCTRVGSFTAPALGLIECGDTLVLLPRFKAVGWEPAVMRKRGARATRRSTSTGCTSYPNGRCAPIAAIPAIIQTAPGPERDTRRRVSRFRGRRRLPRGRDRRRSSGRKIRGRAPGRAGRSRPAAATISPLRPNSLLPNSRINRLGQARGRIAAIASSAALAGHSGLACARHVTPGLRGVRLMPARPQSRFRAGRGSRGRTAPG